VNVNFGVVESGNDDGPHEHVRLAFEESDKSHLDESEDKLPRCCNLLQAAGMLAPCSVMDDRRFPQMSAHACNVRRVDIR
jgi:hypothetical protein